MTNPATSLISFYFIFLTHQVHQTQSKTSPHLLQIIIIIQTKKTHGKASIQIHHYPNKK